LQGSEAEQILAGKINGLVSLDTSPFCVFVFAEVLRAGICLEKFWGTSS